MGYINSVKEEHKPVILKYLKTKKISRKKLLDSCIPAVDGHGKLAVWSFMREWWEMNLYLNKQFGNKLGCFYPNSVFVFLRTLPSKGKKKVWEQVRRPVQGRGQKRAAWIAGQK